jgi:hypothetical protein
MTEICSGGKGLHTVKYELNKGGWSCSKENKKRRGKYNKFSIMKSLNYDLLYWSWVILYVGDWEIS